MGAEKGGEMRPLQRVDRKRTGVDNSVERISSSRRIRRKSEPNRGSGGRVTRGGFDM